MGFFSSNQLEHYNLEYQDKPQELFERYDFTIPVEPQSRYLTPLSWILSFPDTIKYKNTLHKDLKGIKPPYLLLCNHSSFLDFKVMTKALFPHRANYVVSIDGFVGREKIMRSVGCIAKRKFTNDLNLIRQLSILAKKRQIIVLYPEARYTLDGKESILPDALGKFIKMIKLPVVTLIMQGHHLAEPMWAFGKHRVLPTEARMTGLLTKEDVKEKEVSEINQLLRESMRFNDYKWMKEKGYTITEPNRAEGLHRILYQCPSCLVEYQMDSKDHRLFCKACEKVYELTETGDLKAVLGDTEFAEVPDWFDWQRANVREEVKRGDYHLETEVIIDSLPNTKGYVPMGKGYLVHNADGFLLTGSHAGEDFQVHRSVASQYSVHVEMNFLNKGLDAVDISTSDDSYFCSLLDEKSSAAKISLATEELYRLEKENR